MSRLANMPEDLRKVRDLTAKFPTAETIKLHRGQCSRLRAKVVETLELAEASCRHPAQYSKVFRELFRVVHRVKTFTDDCCYKWESDFVLAAIKVSAHRERFLKYYVELDWCIFLIERVRDAKGEPVASEKLEGFDWREKVRLLVEQTRIIVEQDFSDFIDVLTRHVRKSGDHQKICATLLRRFKDATDSVVDDVGLEVPPLERKGELIGKGGYGGVYNFKWKETEFALKIPSFNFVTLDREVCIMEKCCHPNIVNLILFHKDRDGEPCLMMEKLSMNLLEYLKSVAKGSSVPPLEAVGMILQVSEGMNYLSDIYRVSHRDLKPENILVKLDRGQDGPVLELQVADFGLAKVRAAIGESSNQTPNYGTTRYRAPEMTRDHGLGEERIREQSLKADIFSFAVTCSCILTGCEPYKDIVLDSGMGGLTKFVKGGGRPSLPADCPAGLRSLLEECWHSEPSERPASFFAISEKLRKLKAMLLTSGVNKEDQPGPSSPGVSAIPASVSSGDLVEPGSSSPGLPDQSYQSGPSFPENVGTPVEPGVRPLRILVLGNAEAVEEICMSICGTPGIFTEDLNKNTKIRVKESVNTSPPLCLYRDATTSKADSIDYTDIMNFVEARNKRWHQVNLKAAWKEDLYYSRQDATPFSNSCSRLHMIWYVCRNRDDLPNALQWGNITKKLNGVPVQMLVTGTNEYENILRLKQRFFDNSQLVEDLIIKVDLKDAEAKDRFWRTCWKVKTRAEIRHAATIIGYIREQLGSSGKVIRVGAVATKSKEFSLKQSKEFILNFLCSYWDVPRSFVEVLPRRTNPQEATKFVPFCLQDAATILYRERECIHGSVPAEASAEFVLREAQACAEAYFKNLDFDACDNMKSGDVQGFLEAVFENRGVPQPLVSGLGQNRRVLKFIGRLRGKGHGP